LVNRLINETLWDVEDGDKWITSDDNNYDYDVVAKKITTPPQHPTLFDNHVVESTKFYDQENTNAWYWHDSHNK